MDFVSEVFCGFFCFFIFIFQNAVKNKMLHLFFCEFFLWGK